jgi:L-glutamine:2-deoxy-scyllo-inosose/3-amino-2,3-dideoxy-scyllo-inosose aminotransferase
MSKLACLGGKPVTTNLAGSSRLHMRPDLERKYLLEEYDSGVWDDWPGGNSQASKFEKEWARFSNSKYAALVNSGTHAIQLALEALGIGAGDEVILPGLTWQATACAVVDINAIPVFVDVNDTLCIDPRKVEAAITRRTKAIIPVHLFHRLADMDKILRIARKHNLKVVEDCAHVHGARWKDKGIGTLGDFGAFSHQRSKPMNAGEGGSLVAESEDLYWRIVSQRSCGREFHGEKVHNGSYRISGFQAAILRGQLAAMRRRAPVVDRNGLALDQAVADAPGVKPLRRLKAITRQCGYGFAFLYDPNAYGGLAPQKFREALAAELGHSFGSAYAPLHHSELYYPHLKRRHQLSASYVKAITPSRWDLPVADDIWHRSIISPWKIFACPPSRAHLLTEAIVKIHDNQVELL